MKFSFLPYTIDKEGLPTLKNSDLRFIFQLIEMSGGLDKVFFSSGLDNADAFIERVKSPNMLFCALYRLKDRDLVGFIAFDTFKDNTCFIHAYLWQPSKDLVLDLKRIISDIMDILDLDVVMALTPLPDAVRLGKLVGFKHVGIIPNAARSYYNNETVDSTLLYFTNKR
ncbi:MAG: hypothetical protein M0R06_00125 [Sphaerochaeta sp.]|jgi:hypothetical protein|nr:hypothetical protein [Sphaerochaeta sp.]